MIVASKSLGSKSLGSKSLSIGEVAVEDAFTVANV